MLQWEACPLCIPGRDACGMICPENQRTPLQRKSSSFFAHAHLPLMTPGRWAWVKSTGSCPRWGSCMNRYAHCHVSLASWKKAPAEGAVKQFCHSNIIFILLEMPSGYHPEIVRGQVWKCCLVCQVCPCLWQQYSPQHGKRFLKTTVLTGILIYSCSTHLQQIQDLLQVPSYSLPTSNSDFVEHPHW